MRRGAGGAGQSGAGQGVGRVSAGMVAAEIVRFSAPVRRWNSTGAGSGQPAFVVIVGGDERHGAAGAAVRLMMALSTSANRG